MKKLRAKKKVHGESIAIKRKKSALISSLKDQLIRILLLNSAQKRCYYLDKLIEKAAKKYSPIRPGRHFSRPKDRHSARTKPKKKMRKEI